MESEKVAGMDAARVEKAGNVQYNQTCYEFLCRDIRIAAGVDPDRRHALATLSMLLTHVGRRAVGGKHLVAITRAADLTRIRPERFMARLAEARTALTAAAMVLEGHLPDGCRQAMAIIVPPPHGDQGDG